MQLKPNVFHSTYYTVPYCADLPSVVTVHDMIHERYPDLTGDESFPERKRKVIETADAVIAVSEETKQDILEYVPIDEEKISVVHHAPSSRFTLPASDEEIEHFMRTHKLRRPYWIYVGGRNGYKNFGRLIRALPSALARTNGKLVAVGGEPALARWEAAVLARNGIEQDVILLSELDDVQLRNAYSAAAAIVCPSLAEGFGIPLLEAMAVGTPVICSDIPVFREVAGDAALYFDPHDEEALAQRMLDALDADTRNACKEAGRTWVKKYSWDKAAAATAEIYERVAVG
jgi:glycosyltransferase involved in cell wall biosynthesis